jgi:hypothetical protein
MQAHGRRRRTRWPRSARPLGRVLVVLAVAATLSGCGVGSGTVRIADAEGTIVAAAEGVVTALSLDVELPVVAGARELCQLRTGESGLRSRIDLRAPLPDGPGSIGPAFDAAAAVLVEAGLVVVDSGVPGTLLAQRDGISVTIGSDGRMLELDAITGCRPR